MAIGGSDLFRVIVLHEVFVPRTAEVQCGGCTARTRQRIRNGKNVLGPLRAYTTLLSDRLSSASFSNVNSRIPGATVLREFQTNR